MTDQSPPFVPNTSYANDSHRVVNGGFITPPGVPLAQGNHYPGEQCAVLGQAYNPGLGHAGAWTAPRMIDAGKHPELVQPGQVLVTKGYDDAARHGHPGGILAGQADQAHIMRTHTVGVVTAPDKNGNFWAIEQYQGRAAHLHQYNVADYHNQKGNNFQILTDEHTGRVTRSTQMVADAQHMAQRDGNKEVVAATTKTLQEMRGQTVAPANEPGQHAPKPPTPAPEPARAANDDTHVLKLGAHGQAVHDLQDQLAKLGYKDSQGQLLKANGEFGQDTKRAVEDFQRDHHLKHIDGKVGPETEKALDAQVKLASPAKAPGLNDPKNPDHAMYQQALDGVHKLDAAIGRTPDQHSVNLAAALVVQAKAEGLTRIDKVEMSPDGSKTFAAQNTSPLKAVADVPTLQAMNTPLQQSSTAAQAVQSAPAQANPAQTANQQQTNQPQAVRA